MFTNKKYESPENLRKCFAKCLKIATAAMKDAENLGLLVSILNKYMYFYLSDRTLIPEADITKLVDLIKENINTIKGDGKLEKAKKAINFFENTLTALESSGISIH